MKKYLFFLLAVLPMALMFTACNDDDDLPDVDITLSYEGASYADGKLYVVRDSTFEITALTVTNREENKAAGIANVVYMWDGYYQGTSVVPPYGMAFTVPSDMPLGMHYLEIECTVFAVDKTLANAYLRYKVEVVASPDDIPAGGAATSVHTTSLKNGKD